MKANFLTRCSLILFSLFCLQITGCKNECKDVECLNGGYCDDGECFCPNGYTGEQCERIDQSALYGTYNCGNQCHDTASPNEGFTVNQMIIAPSPSNSDELIVYLGQTSLIATISGNNLIIEDEHIEEFDGDGNLMFSQSFSGSGYFSNDMLYLSYEVEVWYYYGPEYHYFCDFACPIEV